MDIEHRSELGFLGNRYGPKDFSISQIDTLAAVYKGMMSLSVNDALSAFRNIVWLTPRTLEETAFKRLLRVIVVHMNLHLGILHMSFSAFPLGFLETVLARSFIRTRER